MNIVHIVHDKIVPIYISMHDAEPVKPRYDRLALFQVPDVCGPTFKKFQQHSHNASIFCEMTDEFGSVSLRIAVLVDQRVQKGLVFISANLPIKACNLGNCSSPFICGLVDIALDMSHFW